MKPEVASATRAEARQMQREVNKAGQELWLIEVYFHISGSKFEKIWETLRAKDLTEINLVGRYAKT